jgi:class 3 adenylate cyclase/predicted ATPase
MDIGAWLRGLGLERYEQAFRENDIDFHLLPTLTGDDLREIGVTSLGHRKRLLEAIGAIEHKAGPASCVPHAERRQLTVMFSDLAGSTPLSSRLDPEDLRDVIHGYRRAVTQAIEAAGGHVAKFMGDGVLAYFGWPRADEMDAERAVQAGLAIVGCVKSLVTPLPQPLVARVGIATGLVVVGDLLGEGAAREEAVFGETPNLAARLQEAARPSSVVVSTSTRSLVGDMFVVRDLGPLSLKGFAQPVTAFEVVGERTAEMRFEGLRSNRALPMVGRDQELALVLERWRRAAQGEGQAVLLVGEAGIGKSRLVQATLDALPADGHAIHRYQCSPHHSGTALWPIIQHIHLAAGLEVTDTDAEKSRKLEAMLSCMPFEAQTAVPLIAGMLGVAPGPGYPPVELSAAQVRALTLKTIVEQMLADAGPMPVLIILEDVHWVDPTTLELIVQVLDRITGARVMLLLTSRPDKEPALGGHPHTTRLTLNRLGRASSDAIVARLAGGKSLPAALVGEIAARTDGVPLFIEELTKAVLETDTDGSVVAVPVSLHASLMARLDQVWGVKEVAQLAACIGREFTYPILGCISPLPESELLAALERLAAAELVFRRGLPPDASYTFKHALVRDAAHESLLKVQRQGIHALIARALEERFPALADSEPELLAEHYTEAGLAEPAVDYRLKAGKKALARSAMLEAVSQLTKGLETLKGLPESHESQRREFQLQLALGQASIAARGFAAEETGRAYARAHELCTQSGESSEVFPVLYGRSVFHFQRGELSAAHDLASELVRLGEQHCDVAAQVTGHRMIGSALSQMGRFADSRRQFLLALALYDPVRDRDSAVVYAIDSRVMSNSWLAHLQLILGFPDQAQEHHSEAFAYVRQLSHAGTAAVALAWGCIFQQLLRDSAAARAEGDAAILLASEHGYPLYRAAGTIVRGWALAVEGSAEEGVAEIRRGAADYALTGAEMWSPYFLALLAEAEGMAGKVQAGLDHLEEAIGRANRTGIRWIEAELHRTKGQLLLAASRSDIAGAQVCFDRALSVAREQGALMWQLRAATCLARYGGTDGERQQAVDRLASIFDQFVEGFETPDLLDARQVLGRDGRNSAA